LQPVIEPGRTGPVGSGSVHCSFLNKDDWFSLWFKPKGVENWDQTGLSSASQEVKKCHANQADNYEEDEEAESSQLASSAFMATPLAFTTVTGCRAVISLVQPKHLNQLLSKLLETQPLAQCITTERSIQDPHKHAAPQDFSSASIGGSSVYEEYQQAQDTLTNVNLPKLVHNLCPLKVAFTTCAEGKKRQKNNSWSNFTPSLPSTSVIEEVDNEDMISLGSDISMVMEDIWDSVDEQLSPDMMD